MRCERKTRGGKQIPTTTLRQLQSNVASATWKTSITSVVASRFVPRITLSNLPPSRMPERWENFAAPLPLREFSSNRYPRTLIRPISIEDSRRNSVNISLRRLQIKMQSGATRDVPPWQTRKKKEKEPRNGRFFFFFLLAKEFERDVKRYGNLDPDVDRFPDLRLDSRRRRIAV